ncbi:Sec-independent protein translocase subunit TatA [Amycolatopsis cihanbeyliensis]|uniref:Sec-independent protein translocase protein TatA n=1 Tax=Amycolatopsis cihanbeyliensis TaxID=1128664 RepID=A0A542DCC9_AMYCI|nr:Sec-independent protein translocase subunit TatA [Amycolatopsis cihanbeyliensis]TQJ00722.1 sec-independent protein translocase protein TatA [Amycolatopsis cihanbeyliensis]
MFANLTPWHLAIVALVVILLFGAKKLPDAARSIGKSMKIFKAETKDMRGGGGSDDKGSKATSEEPTDAEVVEPESKQLPQSGAKDGTDQQVADLQRQLDELKKQQAPASADSASKNAH